MLLQCANKTYTQIDIELDVEYTLWQWANYVNESMLPRSIFRFSYTRDVSLFFLSVLSIRRRLVHLLQCVRMLNICNFSFIQSQEELNEVEMHTLTWLPIFYYLLSLKVNQNRWRFYLAVDLDRYQNKIFSFCIPTEPSILSPP